MKTHAFFALAFLLASGLAAAGSLGGSIVGTTNYVFRGVSQTDHEPALQADLHLRTQSGWYAGIWGSITDQRPTYASESEFNFYAGRNWTLTPEWAASLHYVRYVYPDDRPYVSLYYKDYDELQATLSFQGRATVSVAWAPEILRYSFDPRAIREGKQWSWEGSVKQPLWRNLSLTAGVGHYDLSDLFRESYWAWSGGLELTLRRAQLTVTRFGVDNAAQRIFGERTANGRWALTAAWRF